jgi:ABC-type transporter MlaC component
MGGRQEALPLASRPAGEAAMKRVPSWVSGLLFVFLAFAVAARPAQAGQAAEAYVQGLADEVMDILNNDALSERQKTSQIAAILDSNLDIEAIALFALGQYRAGASQADLDDYVPAFRAYLIDFYVGQLSDLEGASLKVTGSHDYGGQKGTVVYSEAESDGDTTEINWRVQNNSSIQDVQLEGVWMAQDLREQLVSVIDQNGGRVSAATERLKEITD